MSTTTQSQSSVKSSGQLALDNLTGDYGDRITTAFNMQSAGTCTVEECMAFVQRMSVEQRAVVEETKAALAKAQDFAQRSTCDLTRARFVKHAKPVPCVIDGNEIELVPYVFSTGSLGYLATKKGKIMVDGTACVIQIGNLFIANSKELPGFKAGVCGKVVDGEIVVKAEK